MPIEWKQGPPLAWPLDQNLSQTFYSHAVINGTEYAVGVEEGSLIAVFVQQHGRTELLDNRAFGTIQEAQAHAEQHAEQIRDRG